MSQAASSAHNDLDQAAFEAREEDYPIPSESAFSNARSLLHALRDAIPSRFEVYPTQDGEIAIDAAGAPGQSVLLLCASDGDVLCLVNMGGMHRRAHYSDVASLPDGFVREALRELVRNLNATR